MKLTIKILVINTLLVTLSHAGADSLSSALRQAADLRVSYLDLRDQVDVLETRIAHLQQDLKRIEVGRDVGRSYNDIKEEEQHVAEELAGLTLVLNTVGTELNKSVNFITKNSTQEELRPYLNQLNVKLGTLFLQSSLDKDRIERFLSSMAIIHHIIYQHLGELGSDWPIFEHEPKKYNVNDSSERLFERYMAGNVALLLEKSMGKGGNLQKLVHQIEEEVNLGIAQTQGAYTYFCAHRQFFMLTRRVYSCPIDSDPQGTIKELLIHEQEIVFSWSLYLFWQLVQKSSHKAPYALNKLQQHRATMEKEESIYARIFDSILRRVDGVENAFVVPLTKPMGHLRTVRTPRRLSHVWIPHKPYLRVQLPDAETSIFLSAQQIHRILMLITQQFEREFKDLYLQERGARARYLGILGRIMYYRSDEARKQKWANKWAPNKPPFEDLRTLTEMQQKHFFFKTGQWKVSIADDLYVSLADGYRQSDYWRAIWFRPGAKKAMPDNYDYMNQKIKEEGGVDKFIKIAREFLTKPGAEIETDGSEPNVVRAVAAKFFSEPTRRFSTWTINLMLLDLLEAGAIDLDQFFQFHPMQGGSFEHNQFDGGEKKLDLISRMETAIVINWLQLFWGQQASFSTVEEVDFEEAMQMSPSETRNFSELLLSAIHQRTYSTDRWTRGITPEVLSRVPSQTPFWRIFEHLPVISEYEFAIMDSPNVDGSLLELKQKYELVYHSLKLHSQDRAHLDSIFKPYLEAKIRMLEEELFKIAKDIELLLQKNVLSQILPESQGSASLGFLPHSISLGDISASAVATSASAGSSRMSRSASSATLSAISQMESFSASPSIKDSSYHDSFEDNQTQLIDEIRRIDRIIVRDVDGHPIKERVSVQAVEADGNCGFTAIGISRERFVQAVLKVYLKPTVDARLKNLIEQAMRDVGVRHIQDWAAVLSRPDFWMDEAHFKIASRLFGLRLYFYVPDLSSGHFEPIVAPLNLIDETEGLIAKDVHIAWVGFVSAGEGNRDMSYTHFERLHILRERAASAPPIRDEEVFPLQRIKPRLGSERSTVEEAESGNPKQDLLHPTMEDKAVRAGIKATLFAFSMRIP